MKLFKKKKNKIKKKIKKKKQIFPSKNERNKTSIPIIFAPLPALTNVHKFLLKTFALPKAMHGPKTQFKYSPQRKILQF